MNIEVDVNIQKELEEIAHLKNTTSEEIAKIVLEQYTSRYKSLVTSAIRSADNALKK